MAKNIETSPAKKNAETPQRSRTLFDVDLVLVQFSWMYDIFENSQKALNCFV